MEIHGTDLSPLQVPCTAVTGCWQSQALQNWAHGSRASADPMCVGTLGVGVQLQFTKASGDLGSYFRC